MTWATISTRLAQLGGADPRVLPKVPGAKGKFTQMGLVLLSTAGLAVVSMSFALIDALKAPWPIAVALGLGWGFVILNLDRLLIQNLRLNGRVGQTILMILPRLAIAALLGLVIATPLVVRVFQPEIVAEMTEENAKQANVLGETRTGSAEAKRLDEVEAKISTNEDIKAGNMPGITSPNVVSATDQLERTETALQQKQKQTQDLYNQMMCEKDGVRCHAASGKPGEGERYDALKRMYDVALSESKSARTTRETAQKALDAANASAARGSDQILAEGQKQADAELPALYAERDQLQAAIGRQTAGDSEVTAASTGLLARIEALHRIGQKNASAFWAHVAVAGLLFMIELLPVLVKLLTSIGPPSLYDQISDLEDKTTFDDATRRRHEERRRIENESKKQRAVEDDMLAREKNLGVRGNAHVEQEMEKILDAALADWSRKVQRTLNNSGSALSGNTTNGGSPVNGARHAANGSSPTTVPPQGKGRTPYNLPPMGTP